MIQQADVNMAMIQQAAEELEIGVPIRSWRVDGGELVLELAYGGQARWGVAAGPPEAPAGKPWQFREEYRRGKAPRAIPDGDLSRHRKQILQNIAFSHGFQSDSDYVRKEELVEALTWLRENLSS